MSVCVWCTYMCMYVFVCLRLCVCVCGMVCVCVVYLHVCVRVRALSPGILRELCHSPNIPLSLTLASHILALTAFTVLTTPCQNCSVGDRSSVFCLEF